MKPFRQNVKKEEKAINYFFMILLFLNFSHLAIASYNISKINIYTNDNKELPDNMPQRLELFDKIYKENFWGEFPDMKRTK